MKPVLLKPQRKIVGQSKIELESVESTNSWVLERPDLLAMDGLVVTARSQTGGRGRYNRPWSGGSARHLFTTLVIHPTLLPEYIPTITLLLGLATHRALAEHNVKGVAIKWPNDLLIEGKKFCGILCEMKLIEPEQKVIVAGIGMNLEGSISQFPPELWGKVITLHEGSGILLRPEDILETILNQFDLILNDLDAPKIELLLREWERNSCSIGKIIEYKLREETRVGSIFGLQNNGALRVKRFNGEIDELISGEVNWK